MITVVGVALLSGCSGASEVGVSSAKTSATSGSSSAAAETSSSVAASSSAAPAVHGKRYVDPDHAYTITVDPQWKLKVGAPFPAHVEGWYVGSASKDFAPNINVLTQDVPGVSLQEYMDVSEQQIKALPNVEVLSKDLVTVGSRQLGVMEYQGKLAEAKGLLLHFLVVVDVTKDKAEVATLTTTPETFAKLRAKAQPYLMTLQGS